jgi:hemerythrin-like metal-binding protein
MNYKRTGIPDIDEQHARLVACLERLERFSRDGHDFAASLDAMSVALTYTKEHFADEEKLLKERNYPDLEEHIQKHEAITADMNSLWAEIESGEDVGVRLIDKMKEWIVDHIDVDDARYARYLGTAPA